MRLLALVPLFALTACAGEMQGVVRGSGERVTFQYEQGFDSDIYRAQIDSESFQGKAVMDGSSSVVASSLWTSDVVFGTATTNRFRAVLFGDKGSTLNCQMSYADSSGFTTSGGVGVCQHSDGRIIDVLW